MGAPRKVDDETLACLDERLRCRHHLLLVLVNLGLTVKDLATELGVHPDTIRRRDYQLHGPVLDYGPVGWRQRDPHKIHTLKARVGEPLNHTHLEEVSPD